MRITTKQFYQSGIDNILRNQAALNITQNRIASGKRVSLPSDDPIGSSQMILLKQRIARTDTLSSNAQAAKTALETQETSISSCIHVMQRIRELLVQSNNSALNSQDKQTLQIELQSKLEELVSLGNSTDGQGNYIFGGYKTTTPPFVLNAQNGYDYHGDSGGRRLEIAAGMNITVSDSGYELFENIRSGDGRIRLSQLGDANTGGASVTDYAVNDPRAYVPDVYTVQFVTNSDGKTAYQVTGATSGQVIPPLPALLPAQAPTLTPGGAIEFNGICLSLTGTPNPGDTFEISPSQGKSTFSRVQDLITSLHIDTSTDAGKARWQTHVTNGFKEIDQALDALIGVRTDIGARYNALEDAQAINEDCKLSSQTYLSLIEDLDYAEAITELDKQTLSLQAAQQSFLRIQNLSLFAML